MNEREPKTGRPIADLAAAVPRVLDDSPGEPFAFRVGRPGEEPLVLGLLDEAVAWLTECGATGQWGTRPFSEIPRRVTATHEWLDSGATVVARRAGRPVGALVLGNAPSYVEPSDCRETYVVLLVASRHPSARGVGASLLDVARHVAEATHAERLRVDCYAGGDQSLVRFYERNGFTRTDAFRVGDWPGQVLERRFA